MAARLGQAAAAGSPGGRSVTSLLLDLSLLRLVLTVIARPVLTPFHGAVSLAHRAWALALALRRALLRLLGWLAAPSPALRHAWAPVAGGADVRRWHVAAGAGAGASALPSAAAVLGAAPWQPAVSRQQLEGWRRSGRSGRPHVGPT